MKLKAQALFRSFLYSFSLLTLLASLTGCSDRPVGSKARPFTMMFIPSVDAQTIAARSKSFEAFMQKEISMALYGEETGFYVRTSVPTSYIAVVEALGTNKVDFVVFTTFGYVLAKDIRQYPIEPIATILRGENKEKYYWGQIITRADSGINSIEDLKGKKFAYTDPASLTGFILPSKMMHDKGIETREEVFAQKHDNVVTMVYQKQVDAGATYYNSPEKHIEAGKIVQKPTDARARLVTQFPDVFDKVKIVTLTEKVPNEPWVIRTNLYKDEEMNQRVKKAVTDALFKFAETDEGKALIREIATGNGLVPVVESEYDSVRKLIRESQINIEDLLHGKKKG